mmetsp:Transcript_81238/g.194929  ORF Transcript_81238/g.194929 Transcript_81238/m.194929 type:complete len:262 (+) Transcript_81238:357-1142(+)
MATTSCPTRSSEPSSGCSGTRTTARARRTSSLHSSIWTRTATSMRTSLGRCSASTRGISPRRSSSSGSGPSSTAAAIRKSRSPGTLRGCKRQRTQSSSSMPRPFPQRVPAPPALGPSRARSTCPASSATKTTHDQGGTSASTQAPTETTSALKGNVATSPRRSHCRSCRDSTTLTGASRRWRPLWRSLRPSPSRRCFPTRRTGRSTWRALSPAAGMATCGTPSRAAWRFGRISGRAQSASHSSTSPAPCSSVALASLRSGC